MTRELAAAGHFEPSLGVRFLPRCPSCSARHPLSHTPPLPASFCPACGLALATPGPAIEVPAVLTGRDPASRAARACFAIARWFRRIAP